MKDSEAPSNTSQSGKSKSFYLDPDAKNVKVMLETGRLTKDLEGKENHYQFTPNYEKHLQDTINAIAPNVGMAKEDLTKLIHLAIANDTYSTYRPPNLETKNRVEEGAIGKPMLTKGKSSEGGKGAHGTWDPTKGLIPKDQSMSKLAQNEVAAFQKKVDDSIKIGDSYAFDLKQTEKDGTKIAWHVVNHPSGEKDFIYKKENKEGYFYKNELKEEKSYGTPIVIPVPVQVLGEKVNGKESYYTADYDPLFSATQIPKNYGQKTEFFKPLKEDHFQTLLGKETDLGRAAPNIVRNLGVINATEAALVVDVEILTKNRARHGNDVNNPYSTPKTLAEDVNQGIIAFKPNGDIFLIKNEKDLVKSINEARSEGYGVIPNPQWGWKQDSDKQFYVPKERVNWEKDAKLIEEWQKKSDKNPENLEYKEKAGQGKEIYNLKIELERHQYRETLIGEYGNSKDILDPGYITTKTAPIAKQKLQNLEKLYNEATVSKDLTPEQKMLSGALKGFDKSLLKKAKNTAHPKKLSPSIPVIGKPVQKRERTVR